MNVGRNARASIRRVVRLGGCQLTVCRHFLAGLLVSYRPLAHGPRRGRQCGRETVLSRPNGRPSPRDINSPTARRPSRVGPSPVRADAGRAIRVRRPPIAPVQDAPLVGTTVSELRQAGCSQVRLSRFPDMWQSSRSALRRLPPVSRDHGLRLRLKSAASSRLPLSRFCRANLEPWAIVPLVRAVRSREVNTSGPSPRVELPGPQSWSFGRGASPPRLSFRPPAAQPGCRPPSDSKF